VGGVVGGVARMSKLDVRYQLQFWLSGGRP